MTNQSNQQILTIMLNESIKDDAVDLIIGLEKLSGFTLSKANGFSRKHAQYDIKEQVEGYKDFYRLDVLHHPDYLSVILEEFSQLGNRFKLKYWVTPLIAYGEI